MARTRDEGIAEEGELFRTHIGGSALTEGVMMRGRLSWAVAVREPSGRIYLEEHEVPGGDHPSAWRRVPIVRGCISFFESMVLSYKAMAIAADHAYDAEGESWASLSEARAEGPGAAREARVIAAAAGEGPARPRGEHAALEQVLVADAPSVAVSEPEPERPAAEGDPGHAADADPADSDFSDGHDPQSVLTVLSVAAGVALGIVLFMAVPVAVSNLLVGEYTASNAIAWNVVEAALRIVIFVSYIWGIGRMPEMARVFGYHGAEHLTIHCFEHGLPLTPANAARFSRLHVRCGTAFLIMTMLVAIVVNTFVPVAAWADELALSGVARAAFVLLTRIVLLPLVAGVSYEVTVRWAGSHPENPLVRVVLWPGLQMQRLTTRVPDEWMLECAIAALRCVRQREEEAGLSVGEPCCE